jgi:hypothetical protein
MRLIHDWKRMLVGAWSARIAIIWAVVSAVYATLPAFSGLIPDGMFAVLSLAFGVAVAVARVTKQPGLTEDTDDRHEHV